MDQCEYKVRPNLVYISRTIFATCFVFVVGEFSLEVHWLYGNVYDVSGVGCVTVFR